MRILYDNVTEDTRRKQLEKATIRFDNKVTRHAMSGSVLRVHNPRKLGQGGSKIAWEISADYVLMLPSTDHDDPSSYWPHVVHDEVLFSNILKAFGLMTTNNKLVTVTINNSTIPAYISTNFRKFAHHGMFVFESKGKPPFAFPYINNTHYWHCMFKSLYKDAINMYRLQLPASGDSVNFIVLSRPTTTKGCDYKVRYFGFDFSSKRKMRSKPIIRYINERNYYEIIPYVRTVVDDALIILGIENSIKRRQILESLDPGIDHYVRNVINNHTNPEHLPFGLQYEEIESNDGGYDILAILGLK